MNAVIYARYSSTGQNEQTIEGQIRMCKEFGEQRGFNIVRTYFDKAKTGTNDNRPDFQKMIREAASGTFQYIIVYKFDRFARNRIDSIMYKQQLKEQGVKVLSALEPVSDDEGGEFYEMFLEWNDEKYSQRLSKRIKDGLTTAIENGTYTGQRLIYGYTTEDTGKVGKKGSIKRIIIDEEQAEIVRYIFSEYASGKGKREITKTLNEQGHRHKGKPFRDRDFEHWLINEKYTGEFTYGGRIVKNQFPQIIDKALFNAVQERLKANKQQAGAKTAREPYILTGKVFCGHCGTAMVACGSTKKKIIHHRYYACKQKKKALCDKKREKKDTLERAVIAYIIAFLQNPKAVNRIADDVIAYYEQRTNDDGLRSIEVKISHAQKQVGEWSAAFVEAKSAMLRANIEKQIADYEILINDLYLQKAKLEVERGAKLCKQDILSFVDELIKGDPNDKEHWQKVVDGIVKKIFVYDNRFDVFLNFTDNDIDRVDLDELKTAISEGFEVRTLTPILHHCKNSRTRMGSAVFQLMFPQAEMMI